MVKIQLETGYLDVKEGTNFPLNFGVADIRDISKRSGGYSKTITLTGSKNNNDLLNHYYDVNVVAGTFNFQVTTKCAVIQNGVPIMEDAYLQLLSVNKVQNTDAYEQGVEYEVLIKDAQSDLFTKIDGAELTDLDFTDLNHIYSTANVVASFSNSVADGYVYPMGGSGDNQFYLQEFKPAIYAKLYFDRIHADAGYSYTWAGLTDAYFDKAIIPFNGDVSVLDYSDYLVDADFGNDTTFTMPSGVNVTTSSGTLTSWTEIQDNQNLFNDTLGEYTSNLTVLGGQSIMATIEYSYDLNLVNSTGSTVWLVDMDSSFFTWQYTYNVALDVFKNGVQINSGNLLATNVNVAEGSLANGTVFKGTRTGTYNIPISNLVIGDVITYQLRVIVTQTGNIRWKNANSIGGADVQVDVQLSSVDFNVKMLPSSNILPYNVEINVNDFVPKQVKQKDFIKSVCNMFNLYAEQDDDNPNKIIYISRDEYYDNGAVKDWSKKLAKDQTQQLQFLPELSAKKLILSYKPDSDEANKTYRDSTNEVYGQVDFTFDNEYIRGTDTKELIFSPTPMVLNTFGAVVPTWGGGAPKNNIRILLHNGSGTCSPYDIYDYGVSGTLGETSYPLVSHFNDHYNPTFDLNYGVNDFYFYDGITLTNNNLFNIYWRRTISQINKGKMLIAYFHLTELDIQNLRLNDKIYIDNSWWNINRVIDYNANESTFTKVELLSVDDEIELPPFRIKPFIPLDFSKRPIKELVNAFTERNNINLSPGDVLISGGIGNVINEGLNGTLSGSFKTMSVSGDNTPLNGINTKARLAGGDTTVQDDDYCIIFTTPAKNMTIPLASDNEGRVLVGKNISSGNMTIIASGGDTIEGVTSVVLPSGAAGTIVAVGGSWYVIAAY